MFPVVKVSVGGLDPKAMYSILLEFVQIDSEGRWVLSSNSTARRVELDLIKRNSSVLRCRYVEGRWIPSGKAERPPSNAIYVHNESPNFGAHWMKEPVNFSKLKLSNKKSEPGMVRFSWLQTYHRNPTAISKSILFNSITVVTTIKFDHWSLKWAQLKRLQSQLGQITFQQFNGNRTDES